MYSDVTKLCIGERSSIQDAVGRIDSSRLGIVVVTDDAGRLVGTITDGDIRRAFLARVDFTQPVSVLVASKTGSLYERPIAALEGAERNDYLKTLKQRDIRHLPIVDAVRRVVGLVTLDEFVPSEVLTLQAVIMAGGPGTRLRPLTETLPKPMLPVGGRPLMEITIEQLRTAGIKRVSVSTHFNGEKITEHFGDGREFGVEINYVAEEQPLGTAGALGLLERPTGTMLVINGDILTDVNFRTMLAFHREHQADLTMAVRRYDVQVPYGVVECQGTSVRRMSEKPTLGFLVNAGIYLLEPSVHEFIPTGERFDMTELIQRLLDGGRSVVSFPIREYWLDVGQHADYVSAQEHAKLQDRRQ